MAVKRFQHVLQLRIKEQQRRDLQDAAQRYGMTPSDLVRLSLKAGLSVLKQKLPSQRSVRSSSNEVQASHLNH